MRLLEEILETAQLVNAGDLHGIAPRGQSFFTVHYRSQRLSIIKQSYPAAQWSEFLELLKFQCGYRSDSRQNFQDGVFYHNHMALRVAFTPYPCEYVTIRRHDLQSLPLLPPCPKKSQFLSLWSQDFKILLIAGGLHSGKTTFYYDVLSQESLQNHTILSLEDPIEKPSNSFFQMSYCSEQSLAIASALVRFDPDLIGLGELRRENDWALLHFLSLSSIRSIATCHGSSLETIQTKVRLASIVNPALNKALFGLVFLKDIHSSPQYFFFQQNHDNFVLL